jgi:hypothetical protein
MSSSTSPRLVVTDGDSGAAEGRLDYLIVPSCEQADGLATAGTTVGFSTTGDRLIGAQRHLRLDDRSGLPLFVVLFSFLFFRTVPNLWFFAGGALIMAGTLLITSKGIGHG